MLCFNHFTLNMEIYIRTSKSLKLYLDAMDIPKPWILFQKKFIINISSIKNN